LRLGQSDAAGCCGWGGAAAFVVSCWVSSVCRVLRSL
jgi:hypothetical protein